MGTASCPRPRLQSYSQPSTRPPARPPVQAAGARGSLQGSQLSPWPPDPNSAGGRTEGLPSGALGRELGGGLSFLAGALGQATCPGAPSHLCKGVLGKVHERRRQSSPTVFAQPAPVRLPALCSHTRPSGGPAWAPRGAACQAPPYTGSYLLPSNYMYNCLSNVSLPPPHVSSRGQGWRLLLAPGVPMKERGTGDAPSAGAFASSLRLGALRSSGLGPSHGSSSTGSESTAQGVRRMTKGVHELWRDPGTPNVHWREARGVLPAGDAS